MTSTLRWHDYSYFPYERDLAEREVAGLLAVPPGRQDKGGMELLSDVEPDRARRLVYFSGYKTDEGVKPTAQHLLEVTARSGRRQATRYSVHGLHEYKGKFNPQVAKAILNIFDIGVGDVVLDPFCGSGTTLVESAHVGARGVGFDLNPLAVYITNAKLLALRSPSDLLIETLKAIRESVTAVRRWSAEIPFDERGFYLREWFDAAILSELERLRHIVQDAAKDLAPLFLAMASDLLRDYSQQDPKDLRIRRRKSALPDVPLHEAFLNRASAQVARIVEAQAVVGTRSTSSWARLGPADGELALATPVQADAAITSPPYAMALPYIDTQRLSLIWLGLAKPSEIPGLEGDLTGSRELRKSRRHFADALISNSSALPEAQHRLCVKMQDSLNSEDGFRRKVVPTLLYRYFTQMQESFRGVRMHLKSGAPYALIVGHNHTTLGGIRFDIDTPQHLAEIAQGVGWNVEELVPLQTYHRFGYHMANAVSAETLIFLRAP